MKAPEERSAPSRSRELEIYLIDGTYELFRHYYALPSARDAQGTEVAAVRGVVGSVLGLINRGVTHLGVFLPFLDEASFAARLLGSIDLFVIWWLISLAIGVGVLYRRRTGPIATSLIGVYITIGIVVAAVKTALSGA